MIDIPTAIGLALALFAVAAVIVQLAAALVVARFRRRSCRGSGWAPPVTVLAPACDRDAAATLAALRRQDYPGPVKLVAGTDGTDETALRDALPGDAGEVVVKPGAERPALLDLMMRRAVGAVVVVCDGGVTVPRDWLSRMVAPLQSRSIGFVACATRAVAADRSLRSRAAALSANTRLLPATLMNPRAAARHGLGRDTLAMRRDDLERIGGFRVLLRHGVPAETVRDRLGLRFTLAPTLPQAVAVDFPPPRPGVDLLFWHPLPLALAVLPFLPDVGMALTAAALLSRLLVGIAAGSRHLTLLPLRDLLALIPFVHQSGRRRSSAPPPALPAE